MEKDNSKMKKVLYWIVGIAGVCLALFITYKIVYSINSKPDVASSTSENVEILHNIYTKEELHQKTFADRYLTDWPEYRDGTLYNLGLCTIEDVGYHTVINWNGTWVITEDFVKQYIDKYSAEEFIELYKAYVASIIDSSSDKALLSSYYGFEDSFEENTQLLEYINNTTISLFELTDKFEVVSYNPAADTIINKSSKTEQVNGQFNVGSDNHIVSRTATMTIDTYEYDGYTVEHRYGKVYHKGVYGWYNGIFKDVKPYFEHVDKYYMYVDGRMIGPAESLEDLERRWLVIGEDEYYERILCGASHISYDGKKESFEFSQPVSILTTSSLDVAERYNEY